MERVFIPWKRISSVHFASLKRVVEYFKRLFRGKFLRRFISWKGQNFKRLFFHGERFLLHKKRVLSVHFVEKSGIFRMFVSIEKSKICANFMEKVEKCAII